MNLFTTALEVVNLALTQIGAKKLAVLDDNTENGRKMNMLYPACRDMALRAIKPNFAKKRAIFHHVVDAIKNISGATAADPVVITSASHGFSNGDYVPIWGVGGMTDLNGKIYIVTVLSASTFSLADVNGNDVDGTDFDAYTSGGYCGILSDPPEFGYDYRYTLPDDYIIMFQINGNDVLGVDHSVEQNELFVNDAEVKAQYIAQITDVSEWDVDFIMCVAAFLAQLASMPVTNLSKLTELWASFYSQWSQVARAQKSQESGNRNGPARNPIINTWTQARNG